MFEASTRNVAQAGYVGLATSVTAGEPSLESSPMTVIPSWVKRSGSACSRWMAEPERPSAKRM